MPSWAIAPSIYTFLSCSSAQRRPTLSQIRLGCESLAHALSCHVLIGPFTLGLVRWAACEHQYTLCSISRQHARLPVVFRLWSYFCELISIPLRHQPCLCIKTIAFLLLFHTPTLPLSLKSNLPPHILRGLPAEAVGQRALTISFSSPCLSILPSTTTTAR